MAATRTPERVIRPQVGPQEDFLSSPADIAIAGGAAGVGKTWGLLLEPIRHVRNGQFGAVIFRRESPQITNEGGLWDESEKIYPLLKGSPRTSPSLEWSFPGGAKVRFAHLQYDKDKLSWDGSQIPLIGFDQLEHFLEGQFWYMFSRNRSMCGVRPYIRATCNPVPEDDPTGGWLNRLIAWWIDQETGYPIWARSGVLRWFVRINDVIEWADSPEELRQRFAHLPAEDVQPKSLTFIPGLLKHNPALMAANPEYRASLLAMPFVERERLLGGNWKVRPAAGKVFNRAWFEIVDAAPADAVRVRAWDKAGTKEQKVAPEKQKGDQSAGVRQCKAGPFYYIEDVVTGRWSSHQRNAVMRQTAELDGYDVQIEVEQEPGSGGKESAELSVQQLAGFIVHVRPSTEDKVTRAYPFAAQCEAGNVKIVRGPWNKAFLDELHNFPDGALDDQVDGASLGFNSLARGGTLTIWGGDMGAPQTEDEKRAAEQAAIEESAKLVQDEIARNGVYWPGG